LRELRKYWRKNTKKLYHIRRDISLTLLVYANSSVNYHNIGVKNKKLYHIRHEINVTLLVYAKSSVNYTNIGVKTSKSFITPGKILA
jgi:hypothetical protein